MNSNADVLSQLKVGAHIHLMGICGTAMASLAGILKSQGFKVSGSDQNVYPPMSTQLEKLGIEIQQGYKKENLIPKPDLVIVGNVISKTFEEAQALLNSDIPYTSLPKAMGEFVIGDRNSVVVSGTHGKTTTTALTTWIAEVCGLKPGYLVGGIPENFPFSFRAPEADWFVIEGDEYDTAFFDKVPKFIYYRPKYLILTSIEFDHADIYSNIDEIKSAFKRLVGLVPADGIIIAHANDENIDEVLKSSGTKNIFRYGLDQGDYQSVGREIISGRNQFSVEFRGQNCGDIASKMFGPHNTLNFLAAFALAHQLKWPLRSVLQAMADFKGVKRRQEVIGEPRGITIIEDFAHHPTAVSLTLQSIKEKYQNRKVFAIFEPRSATSRRKVFQKDYAKAFQFADEVLLSSPFNQQNISESDRFSSEELVQDIKAQGTQAQSYHDVDSIVADLKAKAKPTDIIVVMSNGAFGGIYPKLLAL